MARRAPPTSFRKLGVFISPSGVRSIWLRHDLANFKTRLKALEARVAEDGNSAYANLDFLSGDAVTLLNLEPDADGVVRVRRADLGGRAKQCRVTAVRVQRRPNSGRARVLAHGCRRQPNQAATHIEKILGVEIAGHRGGQPGTVLGRDRNPPQGPLGLTREGRHVAQLRPQRGRVLP